MIDRRALVGRHSPTLSGVDPSSPLSVGNGEFAFTADVTGLQTFTRHYRQVPLCTQSQWGWHAFPLPSGLDPDALYLEYYTTSDGRRVGYATNPRGQEALFHWMRQNPHRLHLGQIGFRILKTNGSRAELEDIVVIEQRLDLWSGVLTSRYAVEEVEVFVRTSCHPEHDVLAVTVESPLIRSGRLALTVDFPYASAEMHAADWRSPDKHHTEGIYNGATSVALRRRLDEDQYYVALAWTDGAHWEREERHSFVLLPSADRSTFEFVCLYTPTPPDVELPSAEAVHEASQAYWEGFWTRGGAIELAGSGDPRAIELERRIVLSQYLTAINCSGSLPPQETGLVCNSWYGKFHLEMHWWHAAHFPLWGRVHLLERSLNWYQKVLPAARRRAEEQGYSGVRWPKMVGPEGRDSPSGIGPLLIWQQPHSILFAESCYQAHGTADILERFRVLVFETAEFMASYPIYDPEQRRYTLGPPVIPAQENHRPELTWNPTFELTYWRVGLEFAQTWRRRLGLRREPAWDRVLQGLAPPPTGNGVYLAHENCAETYTERNYDHPSMLGAYGVLPGPAISPAVMKRTLQDVLEGWRWERTWGWDFPMAAMTAARLGEPELAIRLLLMDVPKNTYLVNGHNWQRENLPVYLPGNGALLLAAAMMAAGWGSGGGRQAGEAPGFPKSWQVRWEGLRPYLWG